MDRNQILTRALPLCAAAALNVGCNLPNLNGDGENPSPDGTFTAEECQLPLNADGSVNTPTPYNNAAYGNWAVVHLDEVAPANLDGDPNNDEEYVCGDGTPYKFFVQFNENATDLTVTLEGGGACFDYETCTKNGGTLHPFRLGEIPNNHMTSFGDPVVALFPHLGRIDNGVATNKYNHVFFPYCTADVYSGDIDRTYPKVDDDGEPMFDGDAPIETVVHHHGRRNMLAAQQWLKDTFEDHTGQMLVTGHSAGAAGIPVSYAQIRNSVAPVCGAALLDSGPIFPPGGSQQQQVVSVRKIWGLDEPTGTEQAPVPSLIDQLDSEMNTGTKTLEKDLQNINLALSRTFPEDRFLFTAFQEDLVFSVFSFMASGVVNAEADGAIDQVLAEWQSELGRLRDWIETRPENNVGYYMPVFRNDNCSHMVATSPWSMQYDSDYVQAGIDGRVHGYFRTDLGPEATFSDLVWNEDHEAEMVEVVRRKHLGDAIRQLLDPGQEVPRDLGEYIPGELTFLQAGTSDEIWYDLFSGETVQDKDQFIISERNRCASIGTYRQPKPYVLLADDQREVPQAVDGEALYRITTGWGAHIQISHPYGADVKFQLNEGDVQDTPYGWGGPVRLEPNTQYLVKVITPSPMEIRMNWW